MCLRRRTRIRSCRPSRRYNRRTRLRFTTQPSRRRSTQIRSTPNRGRACASSRIRVPQRRLIVASAAAIPRRAAELRQLTGPQQLTPRTGRWNHCAKLATTRRPQTFFRRASDSICLSSVRSATRRLQSPVLVFELPQPPHLAHAKVRELLLPEVERRFAHAHLPAHVADGPTALDFAQGVSNLLLAAAWILPAPWTGRAPSTAPWKTHRAGFPQAPPRPLPHHETTSLAKTPRPQGRRICGWLMSESQAAERGAFSNAFSDRVRPDVKVERLGDVL